MEKKWKHTPVFLPGESHGQRSLAGYNPCDHKELDTTEQLSTVHNMSRALNILEYKILKDMAVTPKHLKKMQIYDSLLHLNLTKS